MSRKRAVLGLSLLCALFVSAWAASSTAAGEAKIITTAFRCHEQSSPAGDAEGFSDEHCTVAATGKNVKVEHTEIGPASALDATASNEKRRNRQKNQPNSS